MGSKDSLEALEPIKEPYVSNEEGYIKKEVVATLNASEICSCVIDKQGTSDVNKKVWSVYSNEFDVGELNAYYLTYDEAVKMCHTAYINNEGSEFVIMDKVS